MIVSALTELGDKSISSYEVTCPSSNTPTSTHATGPASRGSSNVRKSIHALTPLFPSILAQLSGFGLVCRFHGRHRREERRPHQLHIVLFTVETVPQPDAPGQVEVLGDASEDVPVSWKISKDETVSKTGGFSPPPMALQ
jgi:hypothetical protein